MLPQQGKAAKPVKEKRRNNEKRKEKSRDAARTRRSRETEIFSELAQSLPLRREEVDQLDKASIMRLSIAFLKVRNMLELFPKAAEMHENDAVDDNENDVKGAVIMPNYFEAEKMILGALDGFLLALSTEGDITYVSQNIADILGLQQNDLLGQPIWDYSHQCDHEELREVLNVKKNIADDGNGSTVPRSIFIRFKCTLTGRGRSVNIKSASYKVIHFSGHIATNGSCDGKREFIGIGRPMPHPSNIEIPLGSRTFLTKHSLDLKFSYVDEKMQSLLGYQSQQLLGKSLFELHHGADSDNLMGMFKSLLSKGQIETCGYRFLARTGGYAWVVTQATIVYDKQKPQSVVCVNYVISGVEHENEVFSCAQLEAKQSADQEVRCCEGVKKLDVRQEKSTEKIVPQLRKEVHTYRAPKPKEVKEEQKRTYSVTKDLFIPLSAISPRPESATQKIFVPRTEDMNKGYLMFSEEEPGLTMLKEEPDDLTHLAPTAGDACIPLEESTPFFTSCDVFDDLIDDYCSFLPDDINSPLDSQCSGQNKPNTDPFINYRDESSETSGSPHLLSPGGVSKSPEASSLPSLCSPNGSLQDDELAFMTMSMDDDIDLSMRAPYISMSEADDLPLLISEDLMWGAFPEGLSLHKDIKGMAKEAANATNYQTPQINHMQQQQKMRCCDNQTLSQDRQIIGSCPNARGSEHTDRGGGGDGCTIATDIINSCPDVFSKNNSDLQSWPLNEFLSYTTATNTISPKSINSVGNARGIQQQQQEQFKIKLERNMSSTHKRPLANALSPSEFSTAKRQKNESIATTPQLLQQLMAPTAVQPPRSRQQKSTSSLRTNEEGQCRTRDSSGEESRESSSSWKSSSSGQQSSPQSSNSVLMNLLVSGCDPSLSARCQMEVDVEMDSGVSTGCAMVSPNPMRHVMTNVSNPMIGGGFGAAKCPNERPVYMDEDVMSIESLMTPADMEMWRSLQATVQEKKNNAVRKNSFSTLIDSDNVAIPSLLLELSDQDYELNAPISEFMLQGADLIKALDDPNSQMT
ncbi:protein similar isoform X2 [Lutzomyia longipalpis]|uniref:protein similar isoform X2 n=1 Tax=Lutzomyia longipalpis TaxID=7200 RepID=UPI0024841528|nr:protein similar isoform X2 [Lutzomyia longipalpis]XP_055678319.1 protein similar isoform X2 [Lutzomyia longipalpis]XP_055678320.1 protein similar isoform X2 [Lutzomyia longipalpis]